MRLIPKQHQLKYLSAEDRAYWKGYFQGFADSTAQSESRFKLLSPMSWDELLKATQGMSAQGMSIFEKFEFLRERNRSRHGVTPAETRRSNHAA